MKRLLERHGGHAVPRLAAGLVHSPKLKLVVRAAASLLTQWPAVGKWGLKLLSCGEQGAPDACLQPGTRLGHRRYTSEGDKGVADPIASDTIREQREAIVRIAARHGATEVRLIGSVARGEARPDSDVDLLVTWSEDTSLLDQAALMLELESLLGRKVDIASDGWVKPSIRESVYRDAIAL